MMELPGWTGLAADGQNQVLALNVTPGSQGYNAGIRAGDVLLQVAGKPIAKQRRRTAGAAAGWRVEKDRIHCAA